MKEQLEEFFEKLLTEPEFRDKFAKTKTVKEGYETAQKEGYLDGVSYEEFKEAIVKMGEKVYAKSYRTLDVSELKGVSGGATGYFPKFESGSNPTNPTVEYFYKVLLKKHGENPDIGQVVLY